jgi:hypothetical protein
MGVAAYIFDIQPTIQALTNFFLLSGYLSPDMANELGIWLGFLCIVPVLVEMIIPTVAQDHMGIPAVVYACFLIFDFITDRGFVWLASESLSPVVQPFAIVTGLFLCTIAFEFMAAVMIGFGLRMVLEAYLDC